MKPRDPDFDALARDSLSRIFSVLGVHDADGAAAEFMDGFDDAPSMCGESDVCYPDRDGWGEYDDVCLRDTRTCEVGP